MSQEKKGTYMQGHQESVLRSHKWRTAANSAAYLLPVLKPDMHILDVGCGPGTITADFAALVPQGQVIGLESAPEVLEQAREMAVARGLTNIEFVTGDAHALAFPDGTFDIVHAHQVLQHIPDPIRALREMRRIVKSGGYVAVREGDFSTLVWYPEVDWLQYWHELHIKVARSLGGEPDAGRRLVSWAMQAGFDRANITATSSTWCFSGQEDQEWWGGLWADRTVSSSFARNAVDGGHASQADLTKISQAWREWTGKEDGWVSILHGEILCRV
ncbi:hypothetical protein AcW1_010103 [Taiwanofungus camphoratus]|nr:hypothetical protein AcW1_010103 [Antrodia cinnamomea]KAI0954225.1 hypothetical protein AcV7_007518 [Antrodia cinnamomea]